MSLDLDRLEAISRAALSWTEQTPNGDRHRERGLEALSELVAGCRKLAEVERERDALLEALKRIARGVDAASVLADIARAALSAAPGDDAMSTPKRAALDALNRLCEDSLEVPLAHVYDLAREGVLADHGVSSDFYIVAEVIKRPGIWLSREGADAIRGALAASRSALLSGEPLSSKLLITLDIALARLRAAKGDG